jgi:hypothetical protein
MLTFEVLFALNLALGAVALVRHRAGTFVIIANVCNILRTFSTIAEFGQPRSQRFLPASVFDPSRLTTAANIFAVVTFVAMIAVALPSPKHQERAPLPPLPHWLMGLLASYFIILTLSTKTVFSAAYGDAARGNFDVPQGGLVTLLQGLVLYELYRRVRTNGLTALQAFGLFFMFLVVTDYSKGATGIATGFIFAASFLFFGHTGRSWLRPIKVGAVLATVTILTLFVRGVRSSLYTEGTSAVTAVSQQLVSAEDTRAETGQGIDSNTNGVQYASHVLECVTLYDSGYSREWRSLYDPIVYTFQPSFLMEMLGKERAIEPAWELASYFIHGGGIAIFGEMYWNGGFPCVFLVTSLAFLMAYIADTRTNGGFGWVILYCMYASGLFMGVGYGLTYLFRATSNTLLVVGLYKLVSRYAPAQKAATAISTQRAEA